MTASAPPPRGKVIVMGILFWYPLAGVNYQMLHYMLGLRALGYDVYYVEDTYRAIYDPFTNEYSHEYDNVIKHVVPVLEKYVFGDRWACRDGYGKMHGMQEAAMQQLFRE